MTRDRSKLARAGSRGKVGPRSKRTNTRTSEYVSLPSMSEIEAMPNDEFTFVSTFAGCGGSSLGYRMVGGKCLLAVEWDEHAAECYRLNSPDTEVLVGDVKEISAADVLGRTGLEPGELDVFDGSPPCQGFSTAGRRVLYDSRNNLFEDYVRLLSELKPKVCVMENVSGLVKGKMRLVFAEMLRAMRAAGYRVSARLLSAMYFGVPQNRQRMIFVGVREDLDLDPVYPRAETRPIPLKHALPSLADERSRAIHETGGQYSQGDVTNRTSPVLLADGVGVIKIEHPAPPPLDDSYGRLYDQVPQGGNASHVIGKGWNGCNKPHPDRPAPTLSATQKGAGWGTVVHPTERRALTIEEAKIIMSFPADFELTGSYSEQWKRLGNAVPPMLMRAVADTVKSEILAKVSAVG